MCEVNFSFTNTVDKCHENFRSTLPNITLMKVNYDFELFEKNEFHLNL